MFLAEGTANAKVLKVHMPHLAGNCKEAGVAGIEWATKREVEGWVREGGLIPRGLVDQLRT